MSDRTPFSSEEADPNAPSKRDLAEANRRRIVTAYKRAFATESGKVVLEDLEHVFKFKQWEGMDTENTETVARRALAKGAIYHIHTQLNASLAPSPQRQRKKKASP